MRRSPMGMVLLVGVGVVVGAALFGSEGAAGLLAVPFLVVGFLFKVALFFLFFGLMMRAFGRSGHRRRHRSQWDPESFTKRAEAKQGRRSSREASPDPARPTREDRFEEWHRMAHARQEVDEHVPPVED